MKKGIILFLTLVLGLCYMPKGIAQYQLKEALITKADRMHGLWWNGQSIRYVVKSNNQYVVYARGFNGKTFDPNYQEKVIPMRAFPQGSIIRGYNVHTNSFGEQVISYMVYDLSKTWLIMCKAGGGFEVEQKIFVSGADRLRGWSWNGGVYAHYVVMDAGQSVEIRQRFDGKAFLGDISQEKIRDGDIIRGWNTYREAEAYGIVRGGITYLSGDVSTAKDYGWGLYNRFRKTYLGVSGSSFANSQAVDAQSGWKMEPVGGGYFRIILQETGCAIHVEKNPVTCTEVPKGYWTSHWKQVPVSGTNYFRLQNRFRPEQFLHMEQMPLTSSNVPEGYWTSHWELSKK